MPDETPAQGQAAPAPAPAPSFSMPEKFVNKSSEDIAKAYVELESKLGEQGKRLGDLDSYSKIGTAQQINEALEWARARKAEMDRGELVRRDQARAQAASAQPAQRPWEEESFAFKPTAEQFSTVYDLARKELSDLVQQQVAQAYQQGQGQIAALTAQDARQKAILLRAIKTAIKNPDVDPEALLTDAAQWATKSPEELLDVVLDAKINNPAAQEKKINEMVAQRLAERIQEREAKELADISSATMPRAHGLGHALQNKGGLAAREAENRSVIDNLRKQGINLL